MHQIKIDLMELIAQVQAEANATLEQVPAQGDPNRGKIWCEYQRLRALQNTLEGAFEKLTN